MISCDPVPSFGLAAQPSGGSEVRDRDDLARGANAGFAGIWEACDVVGVVVADRHEEAFLIRVIEKMMAGTLTGGEAAVIAFPHDVAARAEDQSGGALQDEDVFLFFKVIVEAIRVLPGLEHVDSDADLRAAAVAAEALERGRRTDPFPGDVIHVEGLLKPLHA